MFEPKYIEKRIRKRWNYGLSMADFNRFNPSLLNLGTISAEGEERNALAAVFDLEHFTSFCGQIDPHLVIPKYLTEFLDWLFELISRYSTQKREKRSVTLWCQLPFYAKFLGDGVLFLWNTATLEREMIGNTVLTLDDICADFTKEFVPQIKKTLSTRAPARLRCGIARGRIVAIGEGRDFVGPCINFASRLQKLHKFSFAFSNRGFFLEEYFPAIAQKDYVLVKSPVRGVGEDGQEELVYVRRSEFNLLDKGEKRKLTP